MIRITISADAYTAIAAGGGDDDARRAVAGFGAGLDRRGARSAV
jgi:hypothetical protein